MVIELKIPQVGESITEVQVGEWLRSEGSRVKKDEPVVVIETDKVTVELPAPAEGTVSRVLKHEGEAARVGEVIGFMEDGPAVSDDGKSAAASDGGKTSAASDDGVKSAAASDGGGAAEGLRTPASRTARGEEPQSTNERVAPVAPSLRPAPASPKQRVTPAAQRILDEHGLRAEDVVATGPGGRIVKENVLDYVERKEKIGAMGPAAEPSAPGTSGEAAERPDPGAEGMAAPGVRGIGLPGTGAREEQIIPMSPLRRRIAERLVQAHAQAALLTTFNEIDMSAVIALRKEHGPAFQEKHGIKLGFMSFFVKASIEALKLVPGLNAEVRGHDVVYRNYYDIGVAVGGGRGLVVPVMRSAERMSFAEIETAIHDFAVRARKNALTLEELQGGTFTISNGGIYGSMLSTPIVNPPQSGILGMHAIQERPIARDGQVLVRPMMYVALTYDHRIVDGREAVSFLVRIKECIENPARMLIEV